MRLLAIDHIDVWVSAQKPKKGRGRSSKSHNSNSGLDSLRALILNLAIAGRLVEIDVQESKLCRLDEVGDFVGGSGFPKRFQGKKDLEIPFLKVSDMNLEGNEKEIHFANNSISRDEIPEVKCRVHPPNTIIFPKIGGAIATNKRRVLTKPSAIDNNCAGITPNSNVSVDWLYVLLLSIDMAEYQSGTSVPAIQMKELKAIEVTLPSPLSQKRIVAKVDELMGLIDDLEAQAETARESHAELVDALLRTLVESEDANALTQNWTTLSKHFDTLLTTVESVEKLKSAILDLAVRGVLVEQNLEDGFAQDEVNLVKSIKQQMLKNKEIKKFKYTSEFVEDDKIHQIPKNWAWIKFGDILTKLTDGAHHTPKYINEGVPFLSVKDMSSGTLNFDNTRFISQEEHERLFSRCNPERGDLLITKVGTTGVPVVVNTDSEFSLFVSVALLKSLWQHIDVYFLRLMVDSPLVKNQSSKGTEGIGNKNLVLRKIGSFNIVLPPLAEQKRIVAKVDELITLCDALLANIRTSESLKVELAESVVHHASAA